MSIKQKEKNELINDINTDNVLIIKDDIKSNYNFSLIELMSAQEMETCIGGCSGGGTCEDYPHTCGDGCTHLYANVCSGGVGNCENSLWVMLCRCGSSYTFTKGCN